MIVKQMEEVQKLNKERIGKIGRTSIQGVYKYSPITILPQFNIVK